MHPRDPHTPHHASLPGVASVLETRDDTGNHCSEVSRPPFLLACGFLKLCDPQEKELVSLRQPGEPVYFWAAGVIYLAQATRKF